MVDGRPRQVDGTVGALGFDMTAQILLGDILRRPLPVLAAGDSLHGLAGWDSIMMVRLMLRLEEVLGRELTDAELEGLATVGDVDALVRTGDGRA